jgi:hypothetical protein
VQIVALANLLPGQHEADDLDSYMYQTVGHQLVGAYAQCMRLPLYRRRITGQSADQVGPGLTGCPAMLGCCWMFLGLRYASNNIVAAIHLLMYCLVPEYMPPAPACSGWCTRIPRETRWRTCTVCWRTSSSATQTSQQSAQEPSPQVRLQARLARIPEPACSTMCSLCFEGQ